ncbi:MAG: hypothetical protein KGL35_00430 [Bradyrhizobium sp.]|nr:hypothetical protein [Bradyrhizobium sp.]
MTKDEATAKLLGIGPDGFCPDSQALMAFAIVAIIEDCGIDPVKLLVAQQKVGERLTRQRTLLLEQRSQAQVEENKRLAARLHDFALAAQKPIGSALCG